jgi:site-specific DNA-methyltransferase (adenine-specific)
MTGTTPIDTIIQGDCLEEMRKLPDGCIDMILCDLPYGTTACKWDHVIPFEPLWKEYKRLIKYRGAIVLTASQPFTSELVHSNITNFRCAWVWNKVSGSNFQLSKKHPMKVHEDVCVFSYGPLPYHPIMTDADISKNHPRGQRINEGMCHVVSGEYRYDPNRDSTKRYPISIITIDRCSEECNSHNRLHSTQKPVALFEYLIKTYTNEGDLVLDNCIGSGTTAVAAKRTGRHFIGIELSPEYCEIARKRIAAVPARLDRWAEADA